MSLIKKICLLNLLALYCAMPGLLHAESMNKAGNLNIEFGLKGSVQLALANAGKRLVSVGERGSIFVLDDQHRKWKKIPSSVEATLTDVFFVDANFGWVVGHGGIVLATQDGGDHWQQVLDGKKAAHIELSEAKAQVNPSASRIRKAERLVKEGDDKPFLSVYFLDKKRGMVVGAYGLIYQTNDGGATWHSLKGDMDNGSERHLYQVNQLTDGGLLVVGEQGRVFIQDKWGEPLRKIAIPYDGTLFGSVIKDNIIVVYGLRGNAFRSVNRGQSWQKIALPAISLTDGIVEKYGHFVLANEYGQLFVSLDQGKTFTDVLLGKTDPISSMVETEDGSIAIAGVRGVEIYNEFGAVWR